MISVGMMYEQRTFYCFLPLFKKTIKKRQTVHSTALRVDQRFILND